MSARPAVRGGLPRRRLRKLPAAHGGIVAVLAMAGAWLGHLFEYVRVSGWHAGLASTTTSVHAYFLPAGLGLLAAVAGVSVAAGRVWTALGHRLAAAERDRWVAPRPPRAFNDHHLTPGPVSLGRLWLRLTLLQTGIWIVQENLESIVAGHHAPWLGVLGGAHVLAPLVQAEVALFLASAYFLIRRQLNRRQGTVQTLETFLARRWRRVLDTTWFVLPASAAAQTPLQRWGAQRWQRPPPAVRGFTPSFA